MKSTKKWLSLLLAVVMVASVFAGCGNNGESNAVNADIASKEELDPAKIGDYGKLKLPIDKNYTKVTMICNSTVEGQNDSFVVKELRRRTGINLQLDVIPNASFTQKVKVLLAAKDEMQDIFAGLSHQEINEYGMQGAFVAIDDHLDELPNISASYFDPDDEDMVNARIYFMAADGKTYQFPSINQKPTVTHGFMYRKDVFDKNGIKMWTNNDEFLDALRQLKKIYPNSTPFVSKNGANIFEKLLPQFGMATIEGTPFWFDHDVQEWKNAYAQPGFKEELDFLKVMLKEGLLDPEFLTCTQPSWTTKMTQDAKAFVTYDWLARTTQFDDQTDVEGYNLCWAPPPSGTDRGNRTFSGGPGIKNGPNALLALKLEDYLISPSGAQLLTLGVEGETYNLDKNGMAEYIGFEGKSVEMVELEEKYGLYISPMYRNIDPRSRTFNLPDKQKEPIEKMEGKLMRGNPSVGFFTKEENALIAKQQVPLKTAADEFATKYVLNANSGEKEWNEWLKKAATFNTDEMLKAYNAAYKRTQEKKK